MPITLYPGGDDPVTPNLKLTLKNMSLTTGNNFEILDAAFGTVGIQVNGSGVTSPNFVNSTSATFSVVGNSISIAAGGSPGGSDTSIQFNNAGAFGGSSNLAWDNINNILTLGGVTGVSGVHNSFLNSNSLVL